MSVPLAYIGIVIIWTTTPLAIKWSGEGAGFLFGISMRMFVALLFSLTLVMILRKKFPWDKKSIHLYLAIGIPLFFSMTFVYWGAQHISSGMVSIIFGLTPIFTGLCAFFLLSEKSFTIPKTLGMLMGFMGLVVIFYQTIELGREMFLGMLAVVFAAFFHSFGTVWVKRVGNHLPVFTANTGGLLVASGLFLITCVLQGIEIPAVVPTYVAYSISYLAIIGSVFGAMIFYYALKHVSASSIGLLPLITPVTCSLLGQQLNGEVISTSTLMGAGILIVGLFVYQWSAVLPSLKRLILNFESVVKR